MSLKINLQKHKKNKKAALAKKRKKIRLQTLLKASMFLPGIGPAIVSITWHGRC